MRTLYIFSGNRRNKFIGKPGIDFPDTQFYGMNHLSFFGVDAEYKEMEDYFWGRIVSKLFGFRIKHSLMFFVAKKYDVVFGISVFYMLIWKKIFSTKTKFVMFNSVLNRMFIVHKPATFKYKLLVWILKEVDGIIFLAHDHLNRVIEKAPFLKDKCFFVPMGVDVTYYKPVYENREKFFLSVGRDNARDYKTIIDVAKRMPNEEFHLVCLPRNISGIDDIPKNVVTHFDIPINELQALYRRARALLLIMHNDSYIEGSDSSGPTVLLEAMSIGLPIIVSKKKYLEDYVIHQKDALLVDFYDVDAIVKDIEIMSDDSFRDTLSRNSREKTERIFNTQEMAKGIAEVFKKIYG